MVHLKLFPTVNNSFQCSPFSLGVKDEIFYNEEEMIRENMTMGHLSRAGIKSGIVYKVL